MLNIQNLISQFSGFCKNPMQYMMQCKMQIPQEYLNNPNQAIQYLMNSGKLSQEQYNLAVQQANQIKNNPIFINYINSIK